MPKPFRKYQYECCAIVGGKKTLVFHAREIEDKRTSGAYSDGFQGDLGWTYSVGTDDERVESLKPFSTQIKVNGDTYRLISISKRSGDLPFYKPYQLGKDKEFILYLE